MWRNRSEFIRGRAEIVAFLRRKWTKIFKGALYGVLCELWVVDTLRIFGLRTAEVSAGDVRFELGPRFVHVDGEAPADQRRKRHVDRRRGNTIRRRRRRILCGRIQIRARSRVDVRRLRDTRRRADDRYLDQRLIALRNESGRAQFPRAVLGGNGVDFGPGGAKNPWFRLRIRERSPLRQTPGA